MWRPPIHRDITPIHPAAGDDEQIRFLSVQVAHLLPGGLSAFRWPAAAARRARRPGRGRRPPSAAREEEVRSERGEKKVKQKNLQVRRMKNLR